MRNESVTFLSKLFEADVLDVCLIKIAVEDFSTAKRKQFVKYLWGLNLEN